VLLFHAAPAAADQANSVPIMAHKRRIAIYDTTLRDGTQGEGFSLSLHDKLAVARKLDELGVDFIEGGFPASNPKDVAFFREVRALNLRHAKVAAFGMTRRKGTKAEDDPGVVALLEAGTPVVTFVGKSSQFQVTTVLGVSPDENLRMIADSVRFIRQGGPQVVWDAEHFFDAFAADSDYALQTLLAAKEAGASVLCMCDTNGGTMPEKIAQAVAHVADKIKGVTLGIHTHNDCALAVANALAAVQAGADHVQGTINGVGERCGNMDLIPLIANLNLKYGHDCLAPGTLQRLTEASRFVYEIANQNLVTNQPYVGSSAFAHKGGMHVHAVQKNASTYEHVDPASVGNERKVLISELSGASNIAAKAGRKFDIEHDRATLRRVVQRVQDLENQGFQFEAAEASFELLLRQEIGRHRRFFELENYSVVARRCVKPADPANPQAHNSDATVDQSVHATLRLRIGDVVQDQTADGDGPVNALDNALRQALRSYFPAIDALHLVDYKVRVINAKDETAARVRVIIDSRRQQADGSMEYFGTIGVSGNIVDASWQALVDAVEYHLIQSEEAQAATALGAAAPSSTSSPCTQGEDRGEGSSLARAKTPSTAAASAINQ